MGKKLFFGEISIYFTSLRLAAASAAEADNKLS